MSIRRSTQSGRCYLQPALYSLRFPELRSITPFEFRADPGSPCTEGGLQAFPAIVAAQSAAALSSQSDADAGSCCRVDSWVPSANLKLASAGFEMQCRGSAVILLGVSGLCSRRNAPTPRVKPE